MFAVSRVLRYGSSATPVVERVAVKGAIGARSASFWHSYVGDLQSVSIPKLVRHLSSAHTFNIRLE